MRRILAFAVALMLTIAVSGTVRAEERKCTNCAKCSQAVKHTTVKKAETTKGVKSDALENKWAAAGLAQDR